jgi:hypothetical protein
LSLASGVAELASDEEHIDTFFHGGRDYGAIPRGFTRNRPARGLAVA